jgi:methionine biosynthesis protein MetW
MADKQAQRLDYTVISGIIEPGAKVLDLGCGNGDLMQYLVQAKSVNAQGIELNEDAIYKCVEKGLSVYHSDIDTGLKGYPDRTFDYVILNQSLQEIKKIDYVMDEVLRVGQKAIVGFPNFAHYRARWMLFFRGKAPITGNLPYKWYDTPNLRFLSIRDFSDFCAEKNMRILENHYLGSNGPVTILPNLFASNAIVVVSR